MRATAQQANIVFRAFADETRLRILNLLVEGELCVCDIEEVMRFTQTKVSRHLAYLRRTGLVHVRRQGLWMLYSIARPKDPEQQAILESLALLLRANPVARRDAQRLLGRIRKGCCATFNRVTPHITPAILQLNKN